MRHYDDPNYRGYPMGPQWGRPHPMDPNWSDGQYHGTRMDWSHRQGAYGFHRQMREHDLQGYGGFNGLYDEGPGAYNAEGQFEHPYFRGRVQSPRARALPRGYDAGMRGRYDQGMRGRYDAGMRDGYGAGPRHGSNGGVRADTRFLRQYNAGSPGLRGGYDRGYGWAPSGPREGELTNPHLRGRETNERGYAGYNRGGFAQEQGPGLDPGRG
ncbi:hypothetical protein [Longimicrobium sp.]|uniref:hypothetical protein n=1 Tax=Longimicrobium sp. TaxID=2029185 RepID=UPI002E3513B4|nr:hypothetical protein [Longimicrobium sp.]HEX6037050.1 hypothetical protein [Longimicrobium sp.]